MLVILYILLFIVGIHVGSFLNVVIDRLPIGKSIVYGRSHCDHCNKTLSWIELIPLLSYLSLGGKCKHCHKKLSIFYPLVESLSGVVFILTGLIIFGDSVTRFFLFGYEVTLIYAFFIFSCLICIFFIDYKFGIIPFKIVFLAIFAALVWYSISPFFAMSGPFQTQIPSSFDQYGIVNYLLSAIGVFLLFFFLFGITKGRGMGFGDVMYALLMGLLLGYPRVIIGLYTAFLTGAIISLILVIAGRKRFKGGTIPFGPFLVGGTVVGLFWGQFFLNIVYSYLHG